MRRDIIARRRQKTRQSQIDAATGGSRGTNQEGQSRLYRGPIDRIVPILLRVVVQRLFFDQRQQPSHKGACGRRHSISGGKLAVGLFVQRQRPAPLAQVALAVSASSRFSGGLHGGQE